MITNVFLNSSNSQIIRQWNSQHGGCTGCRVHGYTGRKVAQYFPATYKQTRTQVLSFSREVVSTMIRYTSLHHNQCAPLCPMAKRPAHRASRTVTIQ